MAVRAWNIIELCAGAGGLGLGIELAVPGARGVAYVEREAAAAAKLVHRMETGDLAPAPVWSDLGTFDARPWRDRVHCVTSGDPCQPNSVAGKRGGAGDERFLIDQVVRIVAECRPLRLFRENVTGNLDGQLAALAPALEGLGYRVAAGIFSSTETGNTHQRERLFIMADAECAQWRAESRPCKLGGPDGISGGRNETAGRSQPPSGALGHAIGERVRSDRPRSDAGAPGGSGGEEREQWVRTYSGEPSSDLVDTTCIGRGEGRAEHELRGGRDTIAIAGGELAHPHGFGRWPKGYVDGAPGDVVQPSRRLRPAVVPGPTDRRWIDVLDHWPELQPALSEEEAQSHLRRGFDAVADRVDRLRLLGNGVDPVAAAYAWLRLDALHRERRARERAAQPSLM